VDLDPRTTDAVTYDAAQRCGTNAHRLARRPLPESEQGMHHIFANQKGIDGYSSGDLADGSLIVYELREAQQKNRVIFEGERRRVDVMIRDSRLYSSTGGWRFEWFWGNDRRRMLFTTREPRALHAIRRLKHTDSFLAGSI
jgi:hypothetical protein